MSSGARSRHLATNMAQRPFVARCLGPQTRCFAFGKGSQVQNIALGDPNPLRVAFGLGRNDKRGPSAYEILKSDLPEAKVQDLVVRWTLSCLLLL